MKPIAALTMLIIAAPALAQTVSPFERGTQSYRAVLNRCGLKPLELVQEALADPAHSLIVLFGKANVYDEQFANGGLVRFLRRGGAILIASDQGTLGELWVQLEIGINGSIVIGPPGDNNDVYRAEYIECPLLQQPKRLALRSKLDLLGSLRVATNRPTFLNRLRMQGEELLGQVPSTQDPNDLPKLNQARVIAELPYGALMLGRQQFLPPEGRFLFAIADTFGRGRYAVLADQSLFLNMMMLQNDNDNVAFAVKLTRWLTEDGQRTQVLFADEGQVRQDFSLNIDYVDPPLPHPDVLGPMVDQLMGSLEHDDFFNQGIQRLIPPYRILRSALLALTALVAVYVLGRMISRRYRADRTVARLPERLSDLAAPVAAVMAPTPATIGSAARELARSALERLLNGSVDHQHPPLTTGSPAWDARVRTIWETAVGTTRHAVRPAELERLARDLVDLQRAVERGDVRLTVGANA